MVDQSRLMNDRIEGLLHRFARLPGIDAADARVLHGVIRESPTLGRQIDTALNRGVLRRLTRLPVDVNSGGAYDPAQKTIMLPLDLLANPALTAFTLGHETQHALNSSPMKVSDQDFQVAVEDAASTTGDYTEAVGKAIKDSRWDEASANLAAWNALVDYVPGRSSTRSSPKTTASQSHS